MSATFHICAPRQTRTVTLEGQDFKSCVSTNFTIRAIVPLTGLEPASFSAPDPKSGVSPNSTTEAIKNPNKNARVQLDNKIPAIQSCIVIDWNNIECLYSQYKYKKFK